MADLTDCLNRAAAVEAAAQADQQAAEVTVLAANLGQLIPVALLARANHPASAIVPVEHRQEGREAIPLAVERRPVAQPVAVQLAADQPVAALPANQAVLAHEHRAPAGNEVASHQVHRKANEAEKDVNKIPRQLQNTCSGRTLIIW